MAGSRKAKATSSRKSSSRKAKATSSRKTSSSKKTKAKKAKTKTKVKLSSYSSSDSSSHSNSSASPSELIYHIDEEVDTLMSNVADHVTEYLHDSTKQRDVMNVVQSHLNTMTSNIKSIIQSKK